MLEFIWQYLVGPIVAEAVGEPALWRGVEAVAGYNLYNTLAWGIIAVSAIYLIIESFEKYEVEFNSSTAFNLMPLILLGGVLRFVQDAADLPLMLEIMLITPIIYIWIALIAVALILLNQFKGLDYKYFNALVLVISLIIAGLLQVPPLPVLAVLAGSSIFAGVYYFLTEGTKYQTYPLILAVMSQFFEALSSIYGLNQGYEPRQLLTSTAVELMGPLGFLAIKAGILAVALKVFFDLEGRWQGVLLVALYSVGFATGVRVLLRASLGV